MKIVQVLPCLSGGDAIGNDVMALKSVIRERGYETEIYAEGIAPNVPDGMARHISELSTLDAQDIIILHVAIASGLNEWIKKQPCKKVMVYHNITPPVFFRGYNEDAAASCEKGLMETRSLKDTFDMVLAVSGYNRQDLMDMGYTCPMHVLPILIPFDDYKRAPSERIIRKYKGDGFTNIIFVGRIVPNKKQEDIIRAFSEYQKYFNPASRLFLVGSPNGFESYERQLKDYVRALGVRDVHFTGHIKFDEILAYYRLADLFLCQSEHEGFCVPLVEAMSFGIPVVAYDSSAIAETLGDSSFLLKEKNPAETAAVMHRILTDPELRQTILADEQERLADFQYEKTRATFWEYMDGILGR